MKNSDIPAGENQRENTGAEKAPAAATRRPWVAPALTDLPKLTDLTLQTGGGIGGGEGVFP